MKHNFEIVYHFIYDVGRSVDIEKTKLIIPANQEIHTINTPDTPVSISIPAPLVLDMGSWGDEEAAPFSSLGLKAKIYKDGVITMMVRSRIAIEPTELHHLRRNILALEGKRATIPEWVHNEFLLLFETIKPAVQYGDYIFDEFMRETYTTFCLLDPVDTDEFIEENSQYLSSFLLGEDPSIELHKTQVDSTLRHSFSFRKNDLAVFDLDRCFIIDPERTYEDMLIIIELANYQLVELRSLDKLLDRWLETAEGEIAAVYGKRRNKITHLTRNVGRLLSLRFDALFILENLENVSKIIGDYYLEQVYAHLCGLFNTMEWEKAIRRRLEYLEAVYSMAKGDVNDRLILILEVLFVLLFIFEIFGLFLPVH